MTFGILKKNNLGNAEFTSRKVNLMRYCIKTVIGQLCGCFWYLYGTCLGVQHQRVTTGQYTTRRHAERGAVRAWIHRCAVQVAVALQRNVVLDAGEDADVESQTWTIQSSLAAR